MGKILLYLLRSCQVSNNGVLHKLSYGLQSSSHPNRLVISESVGYDVGKIISRGSKNSTTSQKVRLIIEKDALAPKGFVIITSFPSL